MSTPRRLPTTASELLDFVPVMPVVVIDRVEDAVPVARALVTGGLPAIELTLRTPAALTAIARIRSEVPEIFIGAGTVTTARQAEDAAAAGAQFLVSPGATPALLGAMRGTGLPFLPGTSTLTEVLAVLETGQQEMKFFPAEVSGGTAYLQAVAGPLPKARFCPTGGIRPDTAANYLALPNVGCVGGTWLTPKDVLAAGDFEQVRALAAKAAELRAG